MARSATATAEVIPFPTAPRDVVPTGKRITFTKATVKGRTSSSKLELTGHEEVVDRCVERARQIEDLKVEQDMEAAELHEAARALRWEAEPTVVKTVILVGHQHRLDLTFRNTYSKVDLGHECELREALGDAYPRLFDRVVEVAPRDPKMPGLGDVLREALGERFALYFEEKAYLRPAGDFMEQRAAIRASLAPEVNATIDDLTIQVQAKPSLGIKRTLEK